MKIKELRKLIREIIKESRTQLLTEAPCVANFAAECTDAGYHSCQQSGTTFECFCEDSEIPWGECGGGIGTGVVMGGGPTYLGKPGTRPSRPGNTPSKNRARKNMKRGR
jgi:hypothetical protein